MFDGATVLAGDSITVGLAPFVTASGPKTTVAKSGFNSRSILGLLQDAESAGQLNNQRNLLALGGTNDIGGSLSADDIFNNLKAIWTVGKNHGMRVFAITIPPAIGYTGWNGRDIAVDNKRRAINALIKASTLPDRVFDSDAMMGDANGRLLPAFDSGDHLHPNKAKMGAAIDSEMLKLPALPIPVQPSQPLPLPKTTTNIPEEVVNGGVVVGSMLGVTAIGWGIWKYAQRKGWL